MSVIGLDTVNVRPSCPRTVTKFMLVTKKLFSPSWKPIVQSPSKHDKSMVVVPIVNAGNGQPQSIDDTIIALICAGSTDILQSRGSVISPAPKFINDKIYGQSIQSCTS